MGRSTRYSSEVRERAVGMVLEHRDEYESQWASLTSIASKTGYASGLFSACLGVVAPLWLRAKSGASAIKCWWAGNNPSPC